MKRSLHLAAVLVALACSETAFGQTPQISRTPVWRSEDAATSVDVAWVDFDSDGDLDLAYLNSAPASCAIYRNDDGTLTRTPVWSFPLPDLSTYLSSFDWADIDHDGDPDVAIGNVDHINVYLNEAGSLRRQVVIYNVPMVSDLRWFDYDGDGDVDLFSANVGANTIYRNDGGVIRATPVWVSSSVMRSTGLDWGDYDGDGDCDLLVANFDAAHEIYRNDGGRLTTTPVWRSAGDYQGVDCQWVDVDGDGDLDATFANWGSITVHENVGGVIDPVPRIVLAHGATNAMDWADFDSDGDLDLATVSFAGPDDLYRNVGGSLTAVWTGSLSGGNEVAWGDYDGDGDPDLAVAKNGPNAVYRNDEGTLAASSREFVFPATTWGDTTRTPLMLKNRSGAPLRVERASFAGHQYNLEDAFLQRIENTLILDPDSSVSTEVLFTPTSGETVADQLEILSVGTARQITSIRLSGQGRPLAFDVTRLYRDQILPAGNEMLVVARMRDLVTVDSAIVELRAGGAGQGRRIRMSRFEDSLNETHVTSIPWDSVSLRGMDYEVEVFNGPLAARSGVNHLRVENFGQPLPFVNRASEYRMLSIPLEIIGPILGSLADDLGGRDARAWRMFAYEPSRSEYVEMPNDTLSSFEEGRGYWLVTREDRQLDTGPSIGISAPTDSAFTIALESGFNVIGTPFMFPVSWDSVRVNGLTMSDARARSLLSGPWRWLSREGTYNDPLTEPVTVLDPFEGYWVRVGAPAALQIPAVEDASPGAPGPSVTAGSKVSGAWYLQIGVRCGSLGDPGNYAGVSAGAAAGRDPYDIPEPPRSPERSVSLYFPHDSWREHAGSYAVDVRGQSEVNAIERPAVLGLRDGLAGYVWRFDVALEVSDSGSIVDAVLTFGGVEQVPDAFEVHLLDLELGRDVDLRHQPEYRYFAHAKGYAREAATRFMLVVGTGEFIDNSSRSLPPLPRVSMLHQNRPNPFVPPGVVPYELARPGRVQLDVLDVLGRRIRVLEDRTRLPGYYEVAWDGRDQRRERVPPGVYFVRLLAPGVSQTRRAVILK